MHPSYDHSIYNNDIALLRFDSPLTGYNETMLPVCLPSSRTNFPTGTNCSVTGWGKTSQTGWVSNKLRVAQVPILNHTQCKTQYLERTGDIVTDRMLCAGYQQGKIDSCKGDSGGPFVCEDRGRYVLVWSDQLGSRMCPGRPAGCLYRYQGLCPMDRRCNVSRFGTLNSDCLTSFCKTIVTLSNLSLYIFTNDSLQSLFSSSKILYVIFLLTERLSVCVS